LPKEEPFQGFTISILFPGLSLALQPWAGVSERLRRIFKLDPYLFKLNHTNV